MLLNALAYAALLAVTGTAVLAAGFGAARVALAVRASHAVNAGVNAAVSDLTQRIAANIQSSGAIDPLPEFTPLPPACADPACALQVRETIAIAQGSATAPAPQLQTNAYVAERRFAARIVVTVQANGSTLVTRTHDVVIRATLSPPYAQVAGAADGDGGLAVATPVPCATLLPGTSLDTQVRVEYRNASTGDCTGANAWSDGSYPSVPASQGWTP